MKAHIPFNVTADEKAKLEREAEAAGLSISGFVKGALGLASPTIPQGTISNSGAAAESADGSSRNTIHLSPHSRPEKELDDLIKEKRLAWIDEQTKLAKARRFDIADRVTRRNTKVRISIPYANRQFEEPTGGGSGSQVGGFMLQGICLTCGRLEIFVEETLRSHKALGHQIV